MKFFKFLSGSLFWNRALCFLTLLFLLMAEAVSPGHAVASAPKHSSNEISLLLNKIKKDAEIQIATIHGISKLVVLKNSLIQEYHLNETAVPQKGDPCPALGFTVDDIGTIIKARALNRAGVYYVVAVEAMLKGHPEIAKWGFAHASSMSIECASYISNLAFILNEYKDFKHAAVLLEYAKQLDPAESSIYVNLAFSYQNLYRYNDAINEMMIAISFYPKLKNYQEMLAGLKKLKKEKGKYYVMKNGYAAKGKTGSQLHSTSGLDAALDMLEEKKQTEFQKDMDSTLNSPLPYDHGARGQKRTWKRNGFDLVNSYDPSAFGENDNALCDHFSQHAHLLVRMGDGMVEKSGFAVPGGNPIEKFIATGGNHITKSKQIVKKLDKKSYNNRMDVVKDFATLGALETANVFYGIAGEIYEMCGRVEPWPEADKLMDDIIDERIKWEKDFWENLDKEEFSKPVCTYKVCVSKGSQGSVKISVSDSWMDVEMKMHPTNIYKYELKLSKGGDIFKKGIGNIASSGVSYGHYFEWKFGRGMSTGTEIGIGGSVGKYVTTKAGKSTSIVNYSFENSTGTTKKP